VSAVPPDAAGGPVDGDPDPYDDAALSRFLADAGLDGPPEAFRARLVRHAAAPRGRPADAWLAILAPGCSPETAAALDRMRDRLAPRPPAPDPTRLDGLRAALGTRGLDGFVVPRADEHQGEYMPAAAERLAWLTGFTGTAGTAVVLADRAVLFVDGRYTLQAGEQVDPERWEIAHLIRTPPAAWLAEAMSAGRRLGYDPRLHSVAAVRRLRAAVEKAGAELVPVEPNPIDDLWVDRPPMPLAPAVPHPVALAGEAAESKRAGLAEGLAADGLDAAVLTSPESVAWLLNLRGGDVPNTPLAVADAVVSADGSVDLFIDAEKLTAEARAHLGNRVAIRPPGALETALDDLGASGRRVRIDPATATEWVRARLERAGARIAEGPDPCVLPRARKNEVEIAGARDAHVRDGAALTRFLRWIDETAPAGGVTELSAAQRLEAFRAASDSYRGPSFDAISGAGPNGAVVHYRVTPDSDRPIAAGSLYLIDSGGQYPAGTTDVTRTVAVGEPDEAMRRAFTLVLRGHIALATARFPPGTTGAQLDALARRYLWQHGLDYDHGTGHGVGSYLGVHEGPQRIASTGSQALEPGMIVSIEPGYYRAGAWGIRIENLAVVVPVPEDAPGMAEAERPMLAFDPLTLAPIDRRLIDRESLTAEEVAWVDAYHARVRATLAARLDNPAERAWLEGATAPLGA